MKDCDIINYGLNAIISEAEANEEAIDLWIDDHIQIDPDHKAIANTKFLKYLVKFGNKFGRKVNLDKVRKAFGELSDREYIAGQIATIIGANPNLAEAITEDLFLEVVHTDLKLKVDPFQVDRNTGQRKLHLYRLPIKFLNRLLNSVNEWVSADPTKVDNFMYRRVWIPWGTTRKMRYNDKSGAFHNVWKTTNDFPDKQGYHIKKFMDKEEGTGEVTVDMPDKKHPGETYKHTRPVRSRGITGILEAVQRLYGRLSNDVRRSWEAPGFAEKRSMEHGESNLMELFTWVMHGRIENITEERAKKMTKATKDRPAELIYKYGPGIYIYTGHEATKNKHQSTGDVIFGWQKPMPLKYDPKIHGTEENMKIFDNRGRARYDTLSLIKNSVPMTDELFGQLNDLATEARPIIDEAYVWFNQQTEKSFANILNALEAHFPNKTRDELVAAFSKGKFVGKWTSEEMANFEFLEENFTKWSLEAPFKPTMGMAAYKQNYYPYIFMPETYTLLLEDAIESLKFEMERVESAYDTAIGEEKQELGEQLSHLRASLKNQEDMKTQMLEMDTDDTDESKMVTRIQSQHFKHISNAFDLLKSRTDFSVLNDSFSHSARTIERNNLTAALIKSLSMTESQGWRNAFVSLYRGTLGRADARSLFAGIDVSDINLNPKVVRGLKALKKYWSGMLAGPGTAVRQHYGHFEKYNKDGLNSTAEAFAIYKRDKDKLKDIIAESGIVIFDDFFTNAVISELEKLEADRDTINAMVKAYVKFFHDRNKGKSKKNAADELYNKLTKLFGREMNWENVLTEEEAKKFNKKLKSEKIQRIANKITTFAIKNEINIRQVFKENNLSDTMINKPISILRNVRNWLGRAGVMTEAEKFIRMTSFILGVMKAQDAGLIQSGAIHELTGIDKKLAIEYGRKATNLMFDFSMSRQGVGESYRSALGGAGGHLTVWKSQKAASDVDLLKHAVSVFDNDNTPLAILRLLPEIFPAIHSDAYLERTNPDAMRLKRWLRGQFLIEGMTQILLVSNLLPLVLGDYAGKTVKWLLYSTGARNMSAGGSPIAGIIWFAIIGAYLLVKQADGDDPFDDEKELEKYLSYQLKNLPGAGVGEGLLFDSTEALLFAMAEKEALAKQKAGELIGYGIPFPGLRQLAKKGVKKILD